MLHAETDELRVHTVVALVPLALVVTQLLQLGAVKLLLRKTLLTGLLGSGHGRDDAAEDVLLLTADRERESLLRAAEEEVAGTARTALEGRHGLLLQLVQTAVEHRGDESVHIVAAQVSLVVLLRVGRGRPLHVEVAEHDGLLLILLDADNHRVVVVHRIVDALGGVLRHGDGGEELLDFPLHLVHVDVAHDDDGLQVGPIPLIIIVAQVLIGEVVYDIHRTDGHTVLILRALVDLRHGLLHESLHGASGTTCAPLLVDDATLLVYLGILEQQVMAPVVEHQQAGVDDTLTLQRSRTDVIDGLLNAGIGIEVGAELHADGLTPGHDAQALALAGEVLRAVEGHVLQEVGQSALAGLFLNAAYTLGDVEISQSRLLGVVADVVRQPVLQLTRAHGGVLWQCLCGSLRIEAGGCKQPDA